MALQYALVILLGFDYVGVGSLLAGITAVISLFQAHRISNRTTKNTETVSYVDNNLKTMQATLEWLERDNARLREQNEAQRIELNQLKQEFEQIEEELERCRDMCAGLSARLTKFGETHGQE